MMQSGDYKCNTCGRIHSREDDAIDCWKSHRRVRWSLRRIGAWVNDKLRP